MFLPSSQISPSVILLSPQYGPRPSQVALHLPYLPLLLSFTPGGPSSQTSSGVTMPSPQVGLQTDLTFTKPPSVSWKFDCVVWRSALKTAIS